ncbi:MAG: saccharopine dehydrogenase C-terminal domain-containing protein [Bacteroidales bacterium]|jgi:saccharopine dehydrogenase-like NADP-dependent oxidoreductase|nr:saccharopine dehydrogenase C-terminal domain-containing protein [Bacteroidales bacterium]
MKKIGILGAGMVSMPIIRYLLDKKYEVSIASDDLKRVEKEVYHYPNGHLVPLNVNNEAALSNYIKEHDIIVSLLPYVFHTIVAKECVKQAKHMVTTSYVKPEMQAMDAEARKMGIAILNEMGLDPGIDHMSAMRIIDRIHAEGGKVEEFYSLCGALPAPESSHDNPFRYKFSWSPKGVVLAGNNNAIYKKQGKIIETPTENLFKDVFTIDFPGLESLDVYPNRDSLSYIDIYNIPETKTMFRGTMRYKGWCESLDVLKQLGMTLPVEENMTGMTYSDYIASKINVKNTKAIKQQLADSLHIDIDAPAMQSLDFLGYFSDKAMNRICDSAYELTSDLMIERMMLAASERDMIVMQHNFVASYPSGKREMIVSRLLDYGIPNGDTSIARSVALPAAIAVDMLAQGKLTVTGVHRPLIPEIYNTILNQLATLGIHMQEQFGLDEKLMIDR